MNKQTVMETCPLCDKGHPKEINSYDGAVKFFCQYCLAVFRVEEESK